MQHSIEILQSARVKSIKLDATPTGREVYLRIGFKDEYTLTRYQRAAVPPQKPSSAIRPTQKSDLPQILELDRAATGAPRENLLTRLIAESAQALVYESSAGQISGFGMMRSGSLANYLGPIIATDPTHAQQLATALSAEKTFCDLPDENQAAAAWAKSQNFTAQRTLTRMYLGENITPAAPQTYFAIAAPDLG
jgi:hypothetical protein